METLLFLTAIVVLIAGFVVIGRKLDRLIELAETNPRETAKKPVEPPRWISPPPTPVPPPAMPVIPLTPAAPPPSPAPPVIPAPAPLPVAAAIVKPILTEEPDYRLKSPEAPKAEPKPEPAVKSVFAPLPDVSPIPEPSAFEQRLQTILNRFWMWFTVGGEFRPDNVRVEYAVATTWLIRGAVAVLLAAVGFFLRYAYHRGLISPEFRVVIAAVIGAGMLALGLRLVNKKYHLVALALLGLGFGTFYFTIYSALSWYKLCGPYPAFGLSIAVTAAAIFLAVALRAQPVALIGVLGGYAAPLLYSTGEKNLPGLFSYLLLLGVGVLAAAWRRNWKGLNLLSFVFTLALYFAALARFYREENDYPVAIVCIAAFFLLFSMLPVFYNLVNRVRISLYELLLLLANAFVFFGAGVILTYDRFDLRTASLAPLGMAIFYLIMLFIGLRREDRDRLLLHTWGALASAAIATAIPMIFEEAAITAVWAVEAMLLIYLYARSNARPLYALGGVLLMLAVIRFAVFDIQALFLNQQNYSDHALGRLFSLGSLTAALYLTAWLFWKFRSENGPREEVPPLITFGTIGLFALLTTETWLSLSRNLPTAANGGVSVVWGVFALALITVGILKKVSACRWCGLALFGVTVVKIFLLDLRHLDSLYRIIAFALLGVALLAGAVLYIRFHDRFKIE